MRIRTHIGVSVDGFVATSDGCPAVLSMPEFVPGRVGVGRAVLVGP